MVKTDKVENTNKMGNPDENPKQNILSGFSFKKIFISFIKLITPKRR